jgi:geranylgeranyl diphosphate synthase type II
MEKPGTLEHLYEEFEAYRAQHSFNGEPANLYAPMQYIMDLGGKRVRPLLTLCSCLAAGGRAEDALPIALGMEQFHNFTLIHDDIMDNASLRRGKPTVHEKWNLPVAILSGDNLLVATYTLLNQLDSRKKQEILSLFNNTAREVCEGQQMDMDFATEPLISTAQYLRMIELKTAVLLGCSSACGALAANADAERVALYYRFAISVGMAFQLKDDYLDTFGDPAQTGKTTGGDIAEGKKTWLYISARQSGTQIEKIYADLNIEQRIADATKLFISQGLDKGLLELSNKYDKEGLECLEQLNNFGENTTLLKSLCKMLAQRTN